MTDHSEALKRAEEFDYLFGDPIMDRDDWIRAVVKVGSALVKDVRGLVEENAHLHSAIDELTATWAHRNGCLAEDNAKLIEALRPFAFMGDVLRGVVSHGSVKMLDSDYLNAAKVLKEVEKS